MSEIRSDRPLKAQLATARMLLAQFAVQVDEHDAMNREQKRSPRGKDLTSRIGGLREGLATWMTRAAELEAAIEAETSNHEIEGQS